MITLPKDRTHEQISILIRPNVTDEEAAKALFEIKGFIFLEPVFPDDKGELFSRIYVGGIDKENKEKIFESIKSLDIIEDVEYFVVRRLKQ